METKQKVIVINVRKLTLYLQIFIGLVGAAIIITNATNDVPTSYVYALWPFITILNAVGLYKLERSYKNVVAMSLEFAKTMKEFIETEGEAK